MTGVTGLGMTMVAGVGMTGRPSLDWTRDRRDEGWELGERRGLQARRGWVC